MSTVEELRAQIDAGRRTLLEKENLTIQLSQETSMAGDRQRLRRELELTQREIAMRDKINDMTRRRRTYIDQDLLGPHMPDADEIVGRERRGQPACSSAVAKSDSEVMNCSEIVATGEYIWKIEGISWLVNTLQQTEIEYAESCCFDVGGATFAFRYSPEFGGVGVRDADGARQVGSLAILAVDDGDENSGITFRYRISVKNKCGAFVQWGNVGDECHLSSEICGQAFGPDVQTTTQARGKAARPMGIFGLSHKEFSESEWVVDDALTVKFNLQVRPNQYPNTKTLAPDVLVPPATLHRDMLSALESGKGSDVTFIVEGEAIKAHSLILCCRSEVFDRQLNGGLRESVSREIVVQDCDPLAFKTLLQFLYTDDFACIEQSLKASTIGAGTGTSSDAPPPMVRTANAQVSLLQSMLAVSHKYQLSRLRLWCEKQLCELMMASEVCSVLCQAHMYEAHQLEEACLKYIKDNAASAMATPAFAVLGKDWPEVMLKISIFLAGLPEERAAAALEAQRRPLPAAPGKLGDKQDNAGRIKRKREE